MHISMLKYILCSMFTWVQGHAIQKGFNFHDAGIKNGINVHEFGIRIGTDFHHFGTGNAV